MAYQLSKPAPGDAKSITSPTKATPAPTRPVPPLDFDRSHVGDTARYGRNQGFHASSLNPGEKLTSDFSVQPADPVLDRIQARGLRPDVGAPINDQLRDIGVNAPPVHPAMAKRAVGGGSPGGPVPSILDKREGPLPQRNAYDRDLK
jgi:hypothetical protein